MTEVGTVSRFHPAIYQSQVADSHPTAVMIAEVDIAPLTTHQSSLCVRSHPTGFTNTTTVPLADTHHEFPLPTSSLGWAFMLSFDYITSPALSPRLDSHLRRHSVCPTTCAVHSPYLCSTYLQQSSPLATRCSPKILRVQSRTSRPCNPVAF